MAYVTIPALHAYTNTHAHLQLAIQCFDMAAQLNPTCERFSEHLDEVQEALRQHEEVCTHICYGSRNDSNSDEQKDKLSHSQVPACANAPKTLCIYPCALVQTLTYTQTLTHAHTLTKMNKAETANEDTYSSPRARSSSHDPQGHRSSRYLGGYGNGNSVMFCRVHAHMHAPTVHHGYQPRGY